MKTYIFDIDGTICENTNGKYELALPFKLRINFINRLYDEGNIIKYFTARGSTTGLDWFEFTESQLKKWGAKYHELILGKPDGDIFIDDKGYNCNNWLFPEEKLSPKKDSDELNFIYKEPIYNHLDTINKVFSDKFIAQQINIISKSIKRTFHDKGKLIFAGNGGSFADAQHLTAEFICRFKNDRRPLPAITLGTNSSNLTAIGNDYGFEDIFTREFIAIANQKDTLIALSTSGNSPNIIKLVDEAHSKEIPFFILTGQEGGKLAKYENRLLKIPSKDTAIIQQSHILIGHIICLNSES